MHHSTHEYTKSLWYIIMENNRKKNHIQKRVFFSSVVICGVLLRYEVICGIFNLIVDEAVVRGSMNCDRYNEE